ncbi:hypothetical protein E4U57_006344 [Claviceps arundinis]|uniref:Uncharacterized protein n=1 Tax=Claviceps arundinis TaxID=1623583 RepID=A0ABQ7P417_9HYPO|nr:hypothetical protein E4U57_006344 [Claviceps arundinis]
MLKLRTYAYMNSVLRDVVLKARVDDDRDFPMTTIIHFGSSELVFGRRSTAMDVVRGWV